MKAESKLSGSIKILLLFVPILAFCASAFYYNQIFSRFDLLSPNILTVGDHFNKAVAILDIHIVPLLFFYIFLTVFVDELKQLMPTGRLSRILWISFWILSNGLAFAFLTKSQYSSFLLIVSVVYALELLFDKSKLEKKIKIELAYLSFFLPLAFILVILGIKGEAASNLYKIKHSTDKILFVDKLESGFLIGRNGKLEYIHSDELTSFSAEIVKEKSRYCDYLAFLCKEKGIKKESK